jgi:hypothetical protein
MQTRRRADSLAVKIIGKVIAASTEMMAMTTSISISVKPAVRGLRTRPPVMVILCVHRVGGADAAAGYRRRRTRDVPVCA